MKQIPILSGRCLVVELPDGSEFPRIGNGVLKAERTHNDYSVSLVRLPLPPGNWRIIGTLNEVTDAELADVTGFYYNKYNERYVEMPTSAMRATPIGDIEDAIGAEGYSFTPSMSEIYDSESQCMRVVESRVLDRSRCLLLGREI